MSLFRMFTNLATGARRIRNVDGGKSKVASRKEITTGMPGNHNDAKRVMSIKPRSALSESPRMHAAGVQSASKARNVKRQGAKGRAMQVGKSRPLATRTGAQPRVKKKGLIIGVSNKRNGVKK